MSGNIHEDAAREKWCPFSRATLYVRGDLKKGSKPAVLVGHGSNRLSTDDPAINKRIEKALAMSGATRCIGSKCMAWRAVPYGGKPRGRCGLVPETG